MHSAQVDAALLALVLLGSACTTGGGRPPGIPNFRERLARCEGHATDALADNDESSLERCRRLANQAIERSIQCSRAPASEQFGRNARFSEQCRVERAQAERARASLGTLRQVRRDQIAGQVAEEERRRLKADEAETRRQRQEKEHEERARNRKVWLERAPERCAATLNKSHCAVPPALTSDVERTQCETACREAIQKSFQERARKALEVCGDEYVESGGKKTACDIALPDGSEVKPTELAEAKASCLKSCSAQGPKLLAAAKKNDQVSQKAWRHVAGYKHCMMAVDQTAQARRYEAYDRDLYAGLMTGADTRCRKAHNCDWVEDKTEMACSYGN